MNWNVHMDDDQHINYELLSTLIVKRNKLRTQLDNAFYKPLRFTIS